MKKKLALILLVDDFEGANFLHKKVIASTECAENVHTVINAAEALEFLKTPVKDSYPHPEIIFLDLNMPAMSGWDFLDEYKKLDREQRWGTLIVILTTSHNPDDEARARKRHPQTVFMHKPLLRQPLLDILKEYFSDNF